MGVTRTIRRSPWILGLTFVAIYLVNFSLAWPTTRWSGISGGSFLFGDFAFLSTWSTECRIDVAIPHLFSVYSQIDSSATCPGFNYGTTLILLLSIFPISFEHYIVAALSIGVLAALALGYFLASTYTMSFWQQVLATLAFFSPSTYLLFERGNLDIVIFLLVVIAATLVGRGALISGFFILIFATLLKFYAFPLVVFASMLARSLRQRIVVIVFTLLTCTLILIDFSRGQVLPVYGPVQFGYPVLDHYFEWFGLQLHPLPSLIGLVAPCCIWVLLVLIEKRAGRDSRARLNQSITNLRDDYAFIFAAITFCAMFFVGLNYDYRLIFLALAGVALILKSTFRRQIKLALWGSLFIALWGSAAFGGNFMFIPTLVKPYLVGGFQFVGDLAVFFWVGTLMYLVALVVARKISWFGELLAFVTRSKHTS